MFIFDGFVVIVQDKLKGIFFRQGNCLPLRIVWPYLGVF